MKFKRAINNLIGKAVDLFMGNGLSQEQNNASGEKVIFPNMQQTLRRVAGECVVLLKNDNTLPLNGNISIFGRCQIDLFYVGNGSGGDVIPPYTVNLLDALNNNDKVVVNKFLADKYTEWRSRKENYPDKGWWGHWPFSLEEMPIDEELVVRSSEFSDTAVVVIGRSAGEDRENKLIKGSYYLTDDERKMLELITKHFKKTCLIINSGNIMDLSFLEDFQNKITAVVYAWQLGQESGNAIADVITGVVNPSGKLTDTIAKDYYDYPSSKHFGDKVYNNYVDDIFVGYRYFESGNEDKVLFPFGFGLSYSKFEISKLDYHTIQLDEKINKHILNLSVENLSEIVGKQVVQVYVEQPNGLLYKADKVLVAFAKTNRLSKNQKQTITLSFTDYEFASYDDSGVSGYKDCYILESGTYKILVGDNVRDAKQVGQYVVNETKALVKHQEICCVKEKHVFKTLSHKNEIKDNKVHSGKRNLKKRIIDGLPENIEPSQAVITFDEVVNGEKSLDEFIATLSVYELEALTRGEGGMHSTLGAKGNAGAIGGVIPSLQEKGVPAVITTDGPSGIRLQRYTSLYPCGFALASSWNVDLIYEMFTLVAKEMREYQTDILLTPGMNIHRNPLCGRNFEYFSEDPLLSGKIAAAIVKGIQSDEKLSACPKHFACNNQETRRNRHDARISERALREIYLKGFEIVVKESSPHTIMTSYNKINGVWSHYNYDLATTVLRKEWGFNGLVMTDWWMQKSKSAEFKTIKNNAYRIRAGVDVLMPGNLSRIKKKYISDKNLIRSLRSKNGLTLGEIQTSAKRTLELCIIKKKNKTIIGR